MYPEEMTASESKWKKEREARQKAMLKRLKALPKDNEIVKIAVKRKANDLTGEDSYKKFEIVDELVSACRKCVTEGDDFDEAVGDLADALSSLVDKGEEESDDDNDE